MSFNRNFLEVYNEEDLNNWNEHFKNAFGLNTIDYKQIDSAELALLMLQGFILEDYLPKKCRDYEVFADCEYWVCTENGDILNIFTKLRYDDEDNEIYTMDAEFVGKAKINL